MSRTLLLGAVAAAVVALVIALGLRPSDDGESPAPVATINFAPTTTVATETVSFASNRTNNILVTFTKPKSWGVLDGWTAEAFQRSSPPRADARATGVTTPAPATSAAPATGAPAKNNEQTPGAGFELEPRGAYSDLSRTGAVVQFAHVANIYSDGCDVSGKLKPPVGPTVQDLVTAWANMPQLRPTTPVDITVDGYTGQQIELTVPDFDDACWGSGVIGGADAWFRFGLWVRTLDPESPDNARPTPNRHFRMWVLDVDGTRLLIAASTDPNTPPEERAALEQLLASIQIG